MRVSDAERQRAVEELRRHCAAGRLDMDEYATRVEAALAASTLAQLDALLSDLPMLRVPEPVASARALAAVGGDVRGEIAGRGLRRTLSVLVAVLLVAAAVILAAAASWVWAVVLVVGWLIGVVQGRLAFRRW